MTGLKLSAKGNFVGGISGQGYAKINGCTVDDAEIESAGWKVGGIIGQLNEGAFTFARNAVQNSNTSCTTYLVSLEVSLVFVITEIRALPNVW